MEKIATDIYSKFEKLRRARHVYVDKADMLRRFVSKADGSRFVV